MPTLSVVNLGKELLTIESRRGANELIGRLNSGDRSAFAELRAIHLCVSGTGAELEIGVDIPVAGGTRKPDFRVRLGESTWTNVEVAAPDVAETREQAEALMNDMVSVFAAVTDGTALDLFLRREPSLREIAFIKAELLRLGCAGRPGDFDYPGLAIISVNMTHPSVVVPRDFPGEPNVPRLGLAKGEGTGASPATKRLSVRYPYSDDRAEQFVTREARQLSRDEAGLIMLSLSKTPGSLTTWGPLVHRRLQPNQHRRVSAICLFTAGTELLPTGATVVCHTSLLENSYALHPLATWLRSALQRFDAA